MTDYHLISHHLCPYVQRAVIVLTEKDIPHRRSYIDLANKPAWFKAMSPLGRVPVMQTGETVIFESQVIAEYLDEITPGSLHPADPVEKARHRSWIEFGSETLSAIGAFYSATDAAIFDQKRAALRDKFSRVNEEIAGPFFSGPTFHMVDGVWGTIFRYFDTFDEIADFGIMRDLDGVNAWRSEVSRRPSVAAAPPPGYHGRLMQFLEEKDRYLTSLIRQAA